MQNTTDRNTTADNMKICVFGGAFNPVHNGHMRLAYEFDKALNFDKLIFVPTADPPHRTSDEFADAADRINMLKLAVAERNNYEISDVEFSFKCKSYTYNTLVYLKNNYFPTAKFYLIVGADEFFNFHTWYRYKDILKLVTLCTSGRENEGEKHKMYEYASALEGLDMNRLFILKSPVLKVSSSEIREKIKQGEDTSALLPSGVYDYIKEKGLYSV